MKFLKTLGLFIVQKIVEIFKIIFLWREMNNTPDSIILVLRVPTAIAAIVFGFYWWTKLVWVFMGDIWKNHTTLDYYMTGLSFLFAAAIVATLLYILYDKLLRDLPHDFVIWISDNWKEAKAKAEKKK